MPVILNKRGVSLYDIQAESGTEARESKNWALSSHGRLQLVASEGLELTINILGESGDDVLTACLVPDGLEDVVVERAADSTCAFLLRSSPGSQSIGVSIGVSFDERSDALDFFGTVSGFHRQAPGAAAAFGQMRGVLGPHASDEELWPQLWRFRLDVRRAVNGFLREACAAKSAPFNFQAQLPQPQPAAALCPAGLVSWQELEAPIFPPSRHISLRDLCCTMSCSKGMRHRMLEDEALWEQHSARAFGSNACSAGGGSAHHGAFTRFAARWSAESTRSCPECRGRRGVVPLLYGFPSSALVAHHQAGLLVLRELCGFLGPPWACQHCSAEWDEYPHASPAARSRSRSGRTSLLPRIPDGPEQEDHETDDESA